MAFLRRSNKEVTVELNGGSIDWVMLRGQKASLVDTIDVLATLGLEDKELDLTGILNLLDYVQDQAAKTLGEDTVYDTDLHLR